MPHSKRPTRRQKIRIRAAGLVPENWLVRRDGQLGMELISKATGRKRTI